MWKWLFRPIKHHYTPLYDFKQLYLKNDSLLIRPFIHFITPALGSNPSCLQAKVGFTPWTSCLSIAVPHRNTRGHLHSLLWPIESSQVASACFWTVEGSYLIRWELTETQGELANSAQETPSAGETSCCAVEVVTTASPCRLPFPISHAEQHAREAPWYKTKAKHQEPARCMCCSAIRHNPII